MSKSIITVGRQYGSGGRYVARLLAEKLEIPYYDKELLAEVAKDSGIGKELLEEHDEKNTRGFLFSMVSGTQSVGDASSMYLGMPLNHRIFLAQFDTIKHIASQGSCVIVGRCADYVLKSEENVVNFFINGNKAEKKRRILERYDIEKNKVEDFIKKTDKRRASYYNYYTDMKWGEPKNFDLCINTSKTGIDGAVELMLAYLDIRQNAVKHD